MSALNAYNGIIFIFAFQGVGEKLSEVFIQHRAVSCVIL